MLTVDNRLLGFLHHAASALTTGWRQMTEAFRQLAGSMMLRRRAAYPSGLSGEWLRENATESAKHSDNR